MKLAIREYLSMLKESGKEELDSLIPDILASMGIKVFNKPQKGLQYGVDLIGVGKDPEDGKKKIFLFVIKQGDITRDNWSKNKNSVRQSIEQIVDAGIKILVEPEYKDLPKQIIVTTNGELKQNQQAFWVGYKENILKRDVELKFWGGDDLASLIETYLFDEFSLKNDNIAKQAMRKTLAFLDLDDYVPKDFYNLIEMVLFERNPKNEKDILKSVKLLNLCLNMIFHWSLENKNIKPAILSAERLLLRLWEFLRKNNLFKKKKVLADIALFNRTYINISSSYFNRIQPLCYVRDGFSASTGLHGFEYQLLTFEHIGILSTMGLFFMFMAVASQEPEIKKFGSDNAVAVADALKNLIYNNPSALNPLYDEHIIDISLGLLLFAYTDKKKPMAYWLDQLFSHIFKGVGYLNEFPIFSDNYDELLETKFDFAKNKKEGSTLLSILLEWCVVLNNEKMYSAAISTLKDVLPGLSLQLWYPDADIEENLYRRKCLSEGFTDILIIPDDDFIQFKADIFAVSKKNEKPESFSFLNYKMIIIGLLASRHYRTPVFPFYWRTLIDKL